MSTSVSPFREAKGSLCHRARFKWNPPLGGKGLLALRLVGLEFSFLAQVQHVSPCPIHTNSYHLYVPTGKCSQPGALPALECDLIPALECFQLT